MPTIPASAARRGGAGGRGQDRRRAPEPRRLRDALCADPAAAGRIRQTEEVTGFGPILRGRNGEGDRYRTDGELRMSVIAPPDVEGHDPPDRLPSPPPVPPKNALWPTASAIGDAGAPDWRES